MDIKKVITDKGFTISSVATNLGIGQSALSQCINNNSMSLSRAIEVAKIIGASLDELSGSASSSSPAPTLLCPHCGKPISIHLEPAK